MIVVCLLQQEVGTEVWRVWHGKGWGSISSWPLLARGREVTRTFHLSAVMNDFLYEAELLPALTMT